MTTMTTMMMMTMTSTMTMTTATTTMTTQTTTTMTTTTTTTMTATTTMKTTTILTRTTTIYKSNNNDNYDNIMAAASTPDSATPLRTVLTGDNMMTMIKAKRENKKTVSGQ